MIPVNDEAASAAVRSSGASHHIPDTLSHTRRQGVGTWAMATVAGAGALAGAVAPAGLTAHLRSAVIASCALAAGWCLRHATMTRLASVLGAAQSAGPPVETISQSPPQLDTVDGTSDVWSAWPELREVQPLASGVVLPTCEDGASKGAVAIMAPSVTRQSTNQARAATAGIDVRQLSARLTGTAVDLERQVAAITESREMAAEVARHVGAQHASAARMGDMIAGAGVRARASAESVRALGDAVGRTEALVATLARLARQTHRVALNASIEATRAGEDGRAFAAVADALRRLAQDGGQAAQAASAVAADARDEVTRASASAEAAAQEVEAARASITTLVAALSHMRDTTTTLDATLMDIVSASGEAPTTLRTVAAALHG